MNFIKYLAWNIKKYKRLILNIFISILVGFLFSSCKVQAAASSDYISLESSYNAVQRDIPFYNNILNNYYGRTDIDISTFTGITSSQLSMLQNGTYSLAMIPCPNNQVWVRIAMQSSGLKMYYYSSKYTLSGNWIIGLDIENKAVISIDQYANNMTLASIEDKPNLTTEEFTSTDYQKYLLYEYLLYYHGEIKSSSQTNSVTLNYYQERNKLNYWDWQDDNLNNNYLSGDIELFDDYFELRNFETNISNYSMYLLNYGVIYDQYGGYRISNGYEWEEISKPNQGGTSTWQITNLFGNKSGDRVYSIGIGTSETPDLIRSEWFDSDDNITYFMNSNSFRLRYYVEDLPEFFIPTESSGSGDSGIISSGDDTEIIGGINGIWQAVLNLPKMILDGLVALFIPSEGFFSSYFDELLTWFEERLGILSYPITFTIDILNRILELDFEEPVISWDDMYVPLFEDTVPLIAAGEINFKTLVESNETILNFYNTYLIIVDGLLVFMIIKLIQRKHDEIVGGASE